MEDGRRGQEERSSGGEGADNKMLPAGRGRWCGDGGTVGFGVTREAHIDTVARAEPFVKRQLCRWGVQLELAPLRGAVGFPEEAPSSSCTNTHFFQDRR